MPDRRTAARPGSVLTLDVEKPAAGGRMLGRHDGQVVLVWGAIPGERVEARVERSGKGVLYADTQQVLQPSADRRGAGGDWRCGGNVFAHIAYRRQLDLKGEIVRDAFARIGRIPLQAPPQVIGSPEQGYRMRSRLHVHEGRLGFYREGTHQLCDAAATGQLLAATLAWIDSAQEAVRREHLTGLAAVEIAENAGGDQRACHLELHAGANPQRFAPLGESLVGLSAQRADRREAVRVSGDPVITEVLRVDDQRDPLILRRDVRAFFQGNRFLIERFVRHVVSLVPEGPVVDLYSGVGLFGLALAVRGTGAVTLVEGDPIGGADLQRNAEPFRDVAVVERCSVEAYLGHRAGRRATGTPFDAATVVLDPPRSGMSRDALNGTIEKAPRRLVYVSCDVATLARDARGLLDAGYELGPLAAFDLFPNTAHVETVATFSR
jgi:23S rRNA (uracil1939-C5)-methyltransferase